jgi:hypothetical protein
MHTFTALYPTRQEAEAVRAELTQLGVIEGDGIRIGDHSTDGFSPDRNGDSRGFWDSFKNMFVAHSHRRLYEEGVRQGGFLLMANVDERYEGRVHDLLERSNALNIDEREQHYRQTGVLATDDTATTLRMERSSARFRSYASDSEQELTPVEVPRRPS